MKLFVILGLVALAIAKPNHLNREGDDVELDPDATIKEFEDTFNQLTNDSEEEKEAAEELAKEEKEIKEANEAFEKGDATFNEQVYPWSDLTSEEMEDEKEGLIPHEDRFFGYIAKPDHLKMNTPEDQAILDEVYARFDRQSLPASYNSQDAGLVTPARNQMNCGSCAAFAATAIHEVCLRKAGTPSDGLNLAEQQVIDCAYDGNGANGCNGAWIDIYTTYMSGKANGVLNHEADYPYLDRQPNLKCQTKANWNAGAKITKGLADFDCTEDKLKSLVYNYGSAVTAIYASDTSFGNYKSGVYQGCTSKSQNHAVTVVGWGTENGTPYWLVKNSWGESWGNKGFIKMRRGNGECGLGTECSVAECSASGTASPAPIIPPPPPIPASQQCDISSLYGTKGITGNYTLRTRMNGVKYVAKVKCKSSVCSPQIAGPSNACMYICGKEKC